MKFSNLSSPGGDGNPVPSETNCGWFPRNDIIDALTQLQGTNEDKKKKNVSRSYEGLKRTDTFLSNYPMKWKRVIGMGGFGVAVKYERTHPDGHVEDVVVKVDRQGSQEHFLSEWMWYKARWSISPNTACSLGTCILGQGG